MEDVLIISSDRSQAAGLWVSYLKTCFNQIRKNSNKPPFRILSIGIEELGSTTLSSRLEEKLKSAKLVIFILCPVFLNHIIQYPEHGSKLAEHVRPERVLAMLLGIEESSISDDHKTALMNYSQWRRMESVKDRDEKFVGDFLAAAMEIVCNNFSQKPQANEKCSFMLMPKKVNKNQSKVTVLLNEPIAKEDIMKVKVIRNNEAFEIPSVKKRNPYTLIFRMPEEFLAVSMLVTVSVERNGTDLGSKLIKCESQLYALDQILKSCDSPIEFMCQALNIVPCDKDKLDDYLVAAFQRNIPPNFNLLQTSGLGHLHRGVISKDEYPTLLHFAAKFGFEKLCWTLLECPGGELACDIRNVCELTPAEIAESCGHAKLSSQLCGYMQMAEFTSVYTFLKGMADNKNGSRNETSDDYLNPRPLSETYQVPPSPRPLTQLCSQPAIGYMQMRSPKAKSSDDVHAEERNVADLRSSNERLKYRKNAENGSCKRDESNEQSSVRKPRENSGNGIQEELIEIINDFKNNVFTISEVEKLVENWRNRNDVRQSFREKQEQLAKMREEYERVQERLKDEMKQVGRLSPMERLRKFFRGKSKEAKSCKNQANSEKSRDGSYCNRPASSLSIQSSTSSSSGRLSTGSHCSGASLGDSGTHSDPESERKFRTNELWNHRKDCENYDVPPSPVSLLSEKQKTSNGILNYDIPPSPISSEYLSNGNFNGLNTPPPSVITETDFRLDDAFYCNVSNTENLLPNESTLHSKIVKSASKNCLKTVEEDPENKTDDKNAFYEYINLPNADDNSYSIENTKNEQDTNKISLVDIHLPDYVNVEGTETAVVVCK